MRQSSEPEPWWRSFLHAGRGLSAVVRSERHFRIHLVLLAVTVALGFFLGLSGIEWIAVALACGLVLVAEVANTAVEYLADALHPEDDPGVGRAKDAGAGAVLVASVAAAVVGAIVFLPKIWERFTG